MPSLELLKETNRQLVICNACRYCEGFCAVFPAMERRRTFSDGDLTYLANLCFDCRACFYACQYAPPHEFAVNVPKVFSELRTATYRDYTWPGVLSGLFRRAGRAAALLGALCVAFVLLLVWGLRGSSVLLSSIGGEGAFYRVVPALAIVVPALAITAYGLAVLVIGAIRFWRASRAGVRRMVDLGSFLRAAGEAFSLRYMRGGGDGCNYPDAAFSHARRRLHHLVFYGFLLDLAATTVAAVYEHLFGWVAPYPLSSWPVVLGSIGGVMLVVGTSGLLYLKWRSDRDPADASMAGMDVAFVTALLLTSLSGLVLLIVRETALMPTLLVVHLGLVAALFLTLPYGKFTHLFYRYAALVRNSVEERAETPAAGH